MTKEFLQKATKETKEEGTYVPFVCFGASSGLRPCAAVSARRLECVELAPAFGRDGAKSAGKPPHSKRFAPHTAQALQLSRRLPESSSSLLFVLVLDHFSSLWRLA